VRPLLQHVLLSAGYTVDAAETALKASSLIEVNSYDLVLTDGVLPDVNGVAVADKAKSRGMRALIITGYALRIPREDLERHDYIMKPLRPRELLAAVARHLEPATRKQPFLFTVLVAEDDSAVRDVVAHALTETGFAVLTAPDAQAALRILAERPVDLLFVDIVMPGMDGVELAERAKALCPGIRVLFATGTLKPLPSGTRNATASSSTSRCAKPSWPGKSKRRSPDTKPLASWIASAPVAGLKIRLPAPLAALSSPRGRGAGLLAQQLAGGRFLADGDLAARWNLIPTRPGLSALPHAFDLTLAREDGLPRAPGPHRALAHAAGVAKAEPRVLMRHDRDAGLGERRPHPAAQEREAD
jgi:DNA-binding response OmpR family regulator